MGVLPADDPRLKDATASDLPSSDFIVREADMILSISAHSKKVLLEHIAARAVTAPPVEVIRLGHFVRSGPLGPGPSGLRAGEFVLSVSDVVQRKNHVLLIKVWRSLLARRAVDLKPLVIVGRIDSASASLIHDITADARLNPYVRILSNTNDRALAWLYANCLFTVFPSLSEGYGLPVAESLAAGKVCVASSTTSVPEASQGLGIHLDPNDFESWLAQIERLMIDPAELRRQEQKIGAFRQASWSDTAADILGFVNRSLR